MDKLLEHPGNSRVFSAAVDEEENEACQPTR
jgi:hypothetical protein